MIPPRADFTLAGPFAAPDPGALTTMKVVPVLFEDHTLSRFRPVSWSLPAQEIRVGMFCLRERVGHLLGSTFSEKGQYLCRSVLAPLQTDPDWVLPPAAPGAGEMRFLWISGRVVAGHLELEELGRRAAREESFFLRDESGPLVMSVKPDESRDLLAHWRLWEEGLAAAGALNTPEAPVPVWEPECLSGPWTALSPEESAGGTCPAVQWIWDVVPGTPEALARDSRFATQGAGLAFQRRPFGVFTLTNQVFQRETKLQPLTEPGSGVHLLGEASGCRVLVGEGVSLGPGTALDVTHGDIILESGVKVAPSCTLEGPLCIGAGSTVKAGATIYGESSFGVVNKISGEIGESTFGDFANKQHDGFIGHAVLGSWINLGAMTTCSDLKNNYGPIRVDLGAGAVDSGRQFVGLLMGDHAKTAIGTLFNTGTSVGFATNIFGGGMPPKCVGNFQWGGQAGCPLYGVDRALETARIVMSRRGCTLTEAHENLFRLLARDSA